MKRRPQSASTEGRVARLLVLLLLATTPAIADFTVKIAWDPPPNEPDVSGYVLFWGPRSGDYTQSLDVGNSLTNAVSGLVDSQAYYFAVKAYNSQGIRSEFSEELTYTPGRTLFVKQASAPVLSTEVKFQGAQGKAYELQVSENLQQWLTVHYTDPLTASDWVTLFDEDASVLPLRFYRLIAH